MFCRQLFFSQVDCSVLRCLKTREREKDLQEYLLSSLSFVCELEILKNDVGSSPLSSPHSVSLLMWGVFFCYLILLFSYLVCGEFSFSSQVLVLEMKRIVKSCTQKCSRDLTADSVACRHGFNCYQCELL